MTRRPSKASWYRLLAELIRVPEGFEEANGPGLGAQDLPEATEDRVPDELYFRRRPFAPKAGRSVRERIAALDDGVSTGLN